jgi:hypothetical protein
MCKTRIQQDFIAKKKQEQNNDKKTYTKLMLNKLKVIMNLHSSIPIGHLVLKRF